MILQAKSVRVQYYCRNKNCTYRNSNSELSLLSQALWQLVSSRQGHWYFGRDMASCILARVFLALSSRRFAAWSSGAKLEILVIEIANYIFIFHSPICNRKLATYNSPIYSNNWSVKAVWSGNAKRDHIQSLRIKAILRPLASRHRFQLKSCPKTKYTMPMNWH